MIDRGWFGSWAVFRRETSRQRFGTAARSNSDRWFVSTLASHTLHYTRYRLEPIGYRSVYRSVGSLVLMCVLQTAPGAHQADLCEGPDPPDAAVVPEVVLVLVLGFCDH